MSAETGLFIWSIFIFLLRLSFCLAAAWQLFFWLFFFARLAFYKEKTIPETPLLPFPISVVICARNEAANLEQNLPRWLEQDYPKFELIVVDDASTDATANVLESFQQRDPRLKIIRLNEKKGGGKKYALSCGIEAAAFDWLLLTDADCAPPGDRWIETMQEGVVRNGDATEIVLGFAPDFRRICWLNIFIRYDTVWTAVQYFSFALAGKPYMGVGRNLMYKKELFRRADGFRAHSHIASGDDDLFINQVATAKNTAVMLDDKTFMYSNPKENWQDFSRQKSRRLSAGVKYKSITQFWLGALAISHFFFYISGFFLLALKVSAIFVCTFYVVRIIYLLLIYAAILKKFRQTDLLPWIPVLDFVHIFLYLYSIPAIFTKTSIWK